MGRIAGTSGGLFVLSDPVDIPDGKTAATLRFNLQTNATVTRDGIYIDNARVICTSGSPSATDLQFLDGTSMATPHVAGLAGLLLAAKPTLTVAQLRNAILNTGDSKSALAGNISTGKRINARTALASVLNNYTVTVSKSGSGGGTITSNPSVINCGSTCSAQFVQGSPTTLSASPDGSSTFGGWSGSTCSGTGTCTVTTDAVVTATFNVLPPPASGGGGGCTLSRMGSGDSLWPALFLLSLGLWAWRLKKMRSSLGVHQTGRK